MRSLACPQQKKKQSGRALPRTNVHQHTDSGDSLTATRHSTSLPTSCLTASNQESECVCSYRIPCRPLNAAPPAPTPSSLIAPPSVMRRVGERGTSVFGSLSRRRPRARPPSDTLAHVRWWPCPARLGSDSLDPTTRSDAGLLLMPLFGGVQRYVGVACETQEGKGRNEGVRTARLREPREPGSKEASTTRGCEGTSLHQYCSTRRPGGIWIWIHGDEGYRQGVSVSVLCVFPHMLFRLLATRAPNIRTRQDILSTKTPNKRCGSAVAPLSGTAVEKTKTTYNCRCSRSFLYL